MIGMNLPHIARDWTPLRGSSLAPWIVSHLRVQGPKTADQIIYDYCPQTICHGKIKGTAPGVAYDIKRQLERLEESGIIEKQGAKYQWIDHHADLRRRTGRK